MISAAAAQDRTAGFSSKPSDTSGALPPARGYAVSRWQLTAGYQFNRINIRGAFAPFNTSGLNVSVTRYLGSLFGVEVGTGSGFGTAAPGVRVSSVFVGGGPHIAYRSQSRMEPWVHALIGLEHFNVRDAPFPGSPTSIAWTLGGGLDYRFASGLAVRAQVDYLGTHFAGAFQRHLQVVGGVAWNF